MEGTAGDQPSDTPPSEALCAKPGLRSSVPRMSSISAPGQAPSTPSLNPQTRAQADLPAPPPPHCTRAGGRGAPTPPGSPSQMQTKPNQKKMGV